MPTRRFSLSWECEGVKYFVEVQQDGRDVVADCRVDDGHVATLRFSCLPWEEPQGVMCQALSRMRSAVFKSQRHVDAMLAQIRSVQAFNVTEGQ